LLRLFFVFFLNLFSSVVLQEILGYDAIMAMKQKQDDWQDQVTN
jgi:hypothetical protein